MGRLSVVLPSLNEERMIAKTASVLGQLLEEAAVSYELLFVDDGSTDGTWQEIENACRENSCVRGIRFSRNFGKEAAIFAGLAQAAGDAVAVMDCDLQHPPQKLLEMYHLWEDGYEVIEGVKSSRGKESFPYKVSAGVFYKAMTKITGMDMKNTSDFKMLDRKAVNSILNMPESNMFFRATSAWIGYRSVSVSYEVQERTEGDSKWNSWSLIRYAFSNMVSFTTVPLQFVTFAGAACFICSLVLLIYSLVQYTMGQAVEGYTTLLVVLLFVGSAVMLSLGIIGYYIAKIYEEVKRRPRYIISKVVRKENYEEMD